MTALLPAVPILAAARADMAVFIVSAAIVLTGAIGVVVNRNPIHSALMLVMTLFGIAVLFIEQDAQFLAAVQVIVYAGAIVVLFLFVIMLLGVDKQERIEVEPLPGQRPIALGLVTLIFVELLVLSQVKHWSTGVPAASGAGAASAAGATNVEKLGRAVFSIYLLPFELTSVLLVIAVIGAVVLARRPKRLPGDEELDRAEAALLEQERAVERSSGPAGESHPAGDVAAQPAPDADAEPVGS